MKKILSLFLLFLCLSIEVFPLDIIFLRHAETIGNAGGDYSGNNGDTLTAIGRRQTQNVVVKLEKFKFDIILASPLTRARLTILPYLKKHGAIAYIWPELAECCSSGKHGFTPTKGALSGRLVNVVPGERQYFSLVEGQRCYYLSDYYEQGTRQVEDLYRNLVKSFWYKDKTILLVGHGTCGKKLIEKILGHSLSVYLENAQITYLRQRADGGFTLLLLNDRPQ
jgi:broad specificity phosphatase PhoE